MKKDKDLESDNKDEVVTALVETTRDKTTRDKKTLGVTALVETTLDDITLDETILDRTLEKTKKEETKKDDVLDKDKKEQDKKDEQQIVEAKEVKIIKVKDKAFVKVPDKDFSEVKSVAKSKVITSAKGAPSAKTNEDKTKRTIKILTSVAIILAFIVMVDFMFLIKGRAEDKKQAEEIAKKQQEKLIDESNVGENYEDNVYKFEEQEQNYNELGDIMVIYYHGLTEKEENSKVNRSIKGFKQDLKALYDNGYRVISMDDYLNGNFNVPKGLTPVVITFDDGKSSSFSFKKSGDTYVPTANSAVGIIEAFNKKHEDFGTSVTMFINYAPQPFGTVGSFRQKFDYLIKRGSIIGNHTYDHKNLSKVSNKKIKNQIMSLHDFVLENTNSYSMEYFAYPYGIKADNSKIVQILKDNGYTHAFTVEPELSKSNPYKTNFEEYFIPRVRGTNNEPSDLGYMIEYYKQNPTQKYVSDGKVGVVSFPKELEKDLDYKLINEKRLKVNSY